MCHNKKRTCALPGEFVWVTRVMDLNGDSEPAFGILDPGVFLTEREAWKMVEPFLGKPDYAVKVNKVRVGSFRKTRK